MALEPPYPDLPELLQQVGDVGRRLVQIEASEGAAGNISVFFDWDVDCRALFPKTETIELPVEAQALAGGKLIVSGSGRRLREIADDPLANVGLVIVNADGKTAKLCTSSHRLFARLTSEFNSHLIVHRGPVAGGANFHAIIHAQPLYLTYLTHISRYQDEEYMNKHILRWQPESIVNLSDGVGVLPFLVPGSDELMEANEAKLRKHRLVIWGKHGLMSRSDHSVKRACDLIEYAETGAKYEYLNLTNHGLADGLSDDEVRSICTALGIKQSIF